MRNYIEEANVFAPHKKPTVIFPKLKLFNHKKLNKMDFELPIKEEHELFINKKKNKNKNCVQYCSITQK